MAARSSTDAMPPPEAERRPTADGRLIRVRVAASRGPAVMAGINCRRRARVNSRLTTSEDTLRSTGVGTAFDRAAKQRGGHRHHNGGWDGAGKPELSSVSAIAARRCRVPRRPRRDQVSCVVDVLDTCRGPALRRQSSAATSRDVRVGRHDYVGNAVTTGSRRVDVNGPTSRGPGSDQKPDEDRP